ncbi:UNVERIFIED_CONTAM: hypothetical protein Slati_3808100 [Sesamum latifolium]|uniref:Integrase catalytic domain-containing protein n=1 Tax=Sesamum latifolium TaxID=2727402 RepID=A0AAW2U5G5_9LAMI
MLSPAPSYRGRHCRPFPSGRGQRKFLLVAVDYFTKWVEAEPLARITEGEVMKFIWKNIICHFGIPREIISDNDRQFQGRKIQEWCQGLRISKDSPQWLILRPMGKLSHKSHLGTRNQKKTGTSRRKLGRRTNQCPVGLQDNPQRVYWRNPFLTSIWH